MRKYQIIPPPSRSGLAYDVELNPEQLRVVMAGEGALLVIAGAGTGKTRTLTYRVARLLDGGVSPARIALCTFTNKAAKEMLARVENLVGSEARAVWGGTFHHLANRLLREYCTRLGYAEGYTILDEEDAKDVLGLCLAGRDRTTERRLLPRPGVLADAISFAANTLTPLDQAILHRAPELIPLLDEMLELGRAYGDRKRAMQVMDFDDLMTNLRQLLVNDPDSRVEISERFEHVLVDEYQDTNALQCEIVDLLASVHHNVTVVGDDAQSIYGFRGADPNNILTFPKRWPTAVLHKLQINYRSTPEILAVANRSIRCNRLQVPKELSAVHPSGPLPAFVPVRDVAVQAAFVAQRVMDLASEGQSLKDMAVLYRAHHQSLELQVELTRRNIPYIVRSGVRFFEQAHIKDVLAHLRLLENPRDELSWFRVLNLQPGIGRAGALRIWQELKDAPNPVMCAMEDFPIERLPSRTRSGWTRVTDLLQALTRADVRARATLLIQAVLENGYRELLPTLYPNAESRREDIEHLAEYADGFESLRSFLSELNLLSGFAAETILDPGKPLEHLTLSSIHQAKGLEWKTVFVVGLNEGLFPHPRALSERGGEEEERRLFYVAVTRTMRELYLVSAMVADRHGGRRVLLQPSRFIDEVCCGKELLERWSIEEIRL